MLFKVISMQTDTTPTHQVQLITYADRFGGKTLRTFFNMMNQSGLFNTFPGGIHFLPTVFPHGGQDAGFDNLTHVDINPELGTWHNINTIGDRVPLMLDLIINHISNQSDQFIDFLEHGDKSIYATMFLQPEKVFGNRPTPADWAPIYRPRSGTPENKVRLISGETKTLWSTFTPSQIDIDVESTKGFGYIIETLDAFKAHGIKWIRLDAIGYAIKRKESSSFMIPETFDFIEKVKAEANSRDINILVETHTHYKNQLDIAKKVDWVYDFALPSLILHSLYNKTSEHLQNWYAMSPRNSITVLGTHDGIGIIDIEDLVPDLNAFRDDIVAKGGNVSWRASGNKASNVDAYQVNSTYYDALGRNDNLLLIARAIQLFSPGLPQVYYNDLLAGTNDEELLELTNTGRDVNRHHYSKEEVDMALQKNVVKKQISLINYRNTFAAFKDGQFSAEKTGNDQVHLIWVNENKDKTELIVNFKEEHFSILENGSDISENFRL